MGTACLEIPLLLSQSSFFAVTGQFLPLEETAYTFVFSLVLCGAHAGVADRTDGSDGEGSRVLCGNVLFPGQIFPIVCIPACE